jgi:hypothetical protein
LTRGRGVAAVRGCRLAARGCTTPVLWRRKVPV